MLAIFVVGDVTILVCLILRIMIHDFRSTISEKENTQELHLLLVCHRKLKHIIMFVKGRIIIEDEHNSSYAIMQVRFDHGSTFHQK